MTYKLLLLDVDGTLTASSAEALPSARVISAVQQAQKLVTVALATGRPQVYAQPVLDALQLRGYGIFNGGAEVVHTTDDTVAFQQYLSAEQLRELVRLALPFGYRVFTNQDQYNHAVRSVDEITQPDAKLFIDSVQTADIPLIIKTLSSVSDVFAHQTTSWGGDNVMDIHVNHILATKRHGAEQLMQRLGIDKSEVMAIGDGHNDIPLLEAAGLKIAMGNAADEVKAIADYVAPSLDDDGVAAAIERYILA